MKKSLLCMSILLLLISLTLTSVTVHPTTIPGYPTVSVYPSLYRAEGIGVTFKINVTIQDVTNLAGIEFKLGYNTTVLTATQIEYGGIFGDTYFQSISLINDTGGWLRYGVMEYFEEPSFNGSAVVATVTFEATAFGSTVLHLYETILGDSAPIPNPIVHTVQDGFFFNAAFHDIAPTKVRAYPTEVEAGETVTINVTVTNEGNFSETFGVTVYADTMPYNYILDPATGMLIDIKVAVGDEIIVGTQTITGLAPGADTTLTVTWNSTYAEEGNYTMSAKSLLPDDDTRDNLFLGDIVKVKPSPLVHDIAVTNVVTSPTEVTVGENVTITVTAKNEGNFSETFDVTVYADSDPAVIGDEITVGTQTGVTLTNETSTTLTFRWDTTGVPEGTYTISAKVPPVVGEREVNKADNTYVDGTVKVQGVAGPNMIIYAVAGVIIVIVAAIVIYFMKFRKSP